jgi:hypothetical protein
MNDDLPLKALVESLEQYNSELKLPSDLILKIYTIEKKYQYLDEAKRSIAYREVEKIIDEYLESID